MTDDPSATTDTPPITTQPAADPLAELPFATDLERDLAQKLIMANEGVKQAQARIRTYEKAIKAIDAATMDEPAETVEEFTGPARGYFSRGVQLTGYRLAEWKEERKKLRAALRAYGWSPDAISKA